MSNPNITLTLTANRVIVIYSNTFRLLIHRENAIFYDTQWRLCLMQCFIVFKNHTREQIQWVDWLIGSIICEFEKEIAKKNWVHVIWCKSTQLASVARWSQRTPFTSEVAGSIPSENILNVTRTLCCKKSYSTLCRKSWVSSGYYGFLTHRECWRGGLGLASNWD